MIISLLLTLIPVLASAKTFHCTGGDTRCLIAAITVANGTQKANTIVLGAGNYTLVELDNVTEQENGLPVVTSPLTIKGAGAESTIIERASTAPAFRILYVATQGSLKLQGVTLRGGLILQPSLETAVGGGILSHGPLTVFRSIITENTLEAFNAIGGGVFSDNVLHIEESIVTRNSSGNADGRCGGVAAEGPTNVIGSEISHNSAGDLGGGLCAFDLARVADSAIYSNVTARGGGGILSAGPGELTVINSTIAFNSGLLIGGLDARNRAVILNSTIVGNEGGVIASTTITMQNTILALNLSNVSSDCGTPIASGPVISLGNNLIGDPTGCTLQSTDIIGDPGLGTFISDGTPRGAHFPLLPTSSAIDGGDDAACPKRDQLGQKRHRPCDIGAAEFTRLHPTR